MTDSNFNTTDGVTPVPGTDITDTNQPGLHQEDININIDTTIPGYPEGSADTTFTVDPAYAPTYGDVPPPTSFGGPDLGEVTHLLHEINSKLDYASHEEEHSAAGHDPIYDVLNVLWEVKASIDHTNQHLHEVLDKLNRTFNS
tara:strand:+ start:19 stop:447 length:429 start_codon:yes stop_codon:yes gene_type:complete